MDAANRLSTFKEHLTVKSPNRAVLLRRDSPSRPSAKGDWEQVISQGLKGTPSPSGKKNARRQTTPDFYGDRALRFQAIAEIDFGRPIVLDLMGLLHG